jgi:hypothetical protein
MSGGRAAVATSVDWFREATEISDRAGFAQKDCKQTSTNAVIVTNKTQTLEDSLNMIDISLFLLVALNMYTLLID